MAFRARAVVAAATTVLVAATLLTTSAGSANAVVNPTGSLVYEDQTFYAYVAAGETLDVSMTRTIAGTGPVAITATSPAGVVGLSCAHSTATATGTVCAGTGLSSPTAGVWTITLDVSGVPRYAYNIQVRNASAAVVTGRIWTTRVSQYQSSTTTQSYWIATREGYLYGIQLRNYNGLGSAIESNGFGLVESGTCTPIYRSAEGTAIGANGVFLEAGVEYSQSCGDDYLIFYEAPASDLPAAAISATGSMWIRPSVVQPSVENLALTADTPTTRAGDITFDLAGVNGGYSIQIDANADGDYSDPVDRLIPYGSPPGAVSVPFDGLDGLGDPIGVCQPLNARVAIDRVGETHFVLQDVEQLGDGAGNAAGVRVSGIAGVPGPNPRLYWNDTTLAPTRGLGFDDTAPFGGPNGTVGTDTSTIPNGNGTHGWRNDWGDQRSIENWTYFATNAGMEVAVPPPCNPSLTIDKSSVLNDELDDNDLAELNETISYSFTVTNTGNVALSDVTVDDARVTGVTPAPVTLAPGASQVFTASPYTVTSADLAAGDLVNTATATGTSPLGPVVSPPDSEITPTFLADPLLSIDKSASLNDTDGNGFADAGEQIVYSFTLANTGNVTLTDVTVVDPRIASLLPEALTQLAPGQQVTVAAQPYAVTAADVAAGPIVNSASATGRAPGGGLVESNDDTATVPIAPPSVGGLALTGQELGGIAAAGVLVLLLGMSLLLVRNRRRTQR